MGTCGPFIVDKRNEFLFFTSIGMKNKIDDLASEDGPQSGLPMK